MTSATFPFRYHAPVMGTECSFLLERPADLDEESARAAVEAAMREMRRLEAIFTTYDATSPMSRFRRGELVLGAAPAEVAKVLELCRLAHRHSSGFFDPWVLPGGVDPTGLAKGWVVERGIAVLAEVGVSSGLVNCGGDLSTFGTPTHVDRWRVGIQHPWRATALACVVELASGSSLATSGRYQQGEHLLDPFSRLPARGIASASATGPSLALADAFATALAVAGAPLIPRVEAAGYAAYVIGDDGHETSSAAFPFAPLESSLAAGGRPVEMLASPIARPAPSEPSGTTPSPSARGVHLITARVRGPTSTGP